MRDIEEENNKSKKKKKKSSNKSSDTSSKLVSSISIAVFLNYTDISILQWTRSLLRSLMRLLQQYDPVVSTESIYLEQIDAEEMVEEIDDNEEENEEEEEDDAVIIYLRVSNVTMPTKELDSLYQFLLGYTGIIQVLSPGKCIENEDVVISTKIKITMVNWKPSRLFLLDCLTELDPNTLWAEDLNFHIYYDRIKGQDLGYNILFPQHFITPSESSYDWKFCDSSDYRRLFTAYAQPHFQRKMLVVIQPNEGTKKERIVPGSETWNRLVEVLRAENESTVAQTELGIDQNVLEVQVKAKSSSWNIIGSLHLDDHQETDHLSDIVDITNASWLPASLSLRGPISTSRIHVEKEIVASDSGKIWRVVEQEVYGVCYSAVHHGGLIICEGVTLFPSRDWTRWALLCSGYLIEEMGDDDEGRSLRKRMICREIFEYLQSLKNYRVEKKEEIIELLKDLFD